MADLAATRDDDGNSMSDGRGKNRGGGRRTERLFNMRANMTNGTKRRERSRGRSGEDEEGGRGRSGSGGEDKFASNSFRRTGGGGKPAAPTRGEDGGDVSGEGCRSDRSRGGSSHGGRSRGTDRSCPSGESSASRTYGRSDPSACKRRSRERSRKFEAAHPWILPPHLRLAPRFDAWIALAATSAAAVASMGQIERTSRGAGLRFDGGDDYALSTCAMSLIFSLSVAAGTRYAPTRTALTRNLFPLGPGRLSDVKLTLELAALTILSIMWMVAMPIIVSGNAHYSARRDVPLAMAGTVIWNANLYYSSWASFFLCAYLWIEVFTLSDRRGTLEVDSSGSGWGVLAGNAFSKRWMLLLLNSAILAGASIGVYTSPLCEGDLLKQTPYCTRALLGALVGGVLQILVILGVAALHRLRKMSRSRARRGRGNNYSSPQGPSMLSAQKLNSGSGLAALLSLIVQGVNAGLLTSSTGGGPGNVLGTLYFSSWLGLALAFEMCLRYLELCSTRSRSAISSINSARSDGRSNNEETTIFEDNDDNDTEESQMMLGMGRVVVEGVPSEDDEGYALDMDEVQTQQSEGESLEAKSFVFPFNADPPKLGQQQQQQQQQKQQQQQQQQYQQQQQRKQIEPEEVRSRSRGSTSRSRSRGSKGSRGSRSSRGSGWKRRLTIGSIDVRSAYGNDPDGAASVCTSSHYDPNSVEDSSKGLRTSRGSSSRPGMEPNQQGNRRRQSPEHLFSYPKPDSFRGQKPMHRSSRAEPDCPEVSHTSYYVDQVEKLDEVPSTTKKRSPPRQGGKSQPEPGPTIAQISQLANKFRGQRENENPPLVRQSTATNLSPLEEGSGEKISPNTGASDTNASNNSGDENGPLTIDGDEAENEVPRPPQQKQQQREVGDNLKTMQAMRGMGAPPPPVQRADRSKKNGSGASDKSKSSRSRSKEKKGSPMGPSPKQSGKSSHSRKTNASSLASTRSGVILTDHNEQEGNGGGGSSSAKRQQRIDQLGSKESARSQRSASTLSSRGASTASAVLTDDEGSGSDPPPAISDGTSAEDDLSGFSALSSSEKSGSDNDDRNNDRAASPSPPPPPFRRSSARTRSDYDDSASQYSSQAPVRSIHAHKGDGSDGTVMSDPTLDTGLDQSPQGPVSRTSPQGATAAATAPPPPRQKKAAARGRGLRDGSSADSATNSYKKKYSDETEARGSSSSDEGPLSHEGGGPNRAVDNIVAAALAYAEKTHGESDVVHRGFDNGRPRRARPDKSKSVPRPPPAKKKKRQAQQQQHAQQQHSLHHHGASRDTAGSSSIHSSFTESQAYDGAGQEGGDPSLVSSAPSSTASVDDLIARALSHARGQLAHDRQGAAAPSPGPPSPAWDAEMSNSESLSQYLSRGNDSGKSVWSMYSDEDTECSTGRGTGTHYNC